MCNDSRNLIGECLEELARRQAKWLGDDLAAIALLAELIGDAEKCLAERVHNAPANGHTWQDIADALGTSLTDARLRFDTG